MCTSAPSIPEPPTPPPPAPAPPPPPTPEAPLPLATPVAAGATGKDQATLRRKKGKRAQLAQSGGGLSALTNKLGIDTATPGAGTGAAAATTKKKKSGLNIPK